MSLNIIISKFVAKLHRYRIMFEDLLTFLRLDNRDSSLITLYLVVVGISIPKNDEYDNLVSQE